MSWWKYRQWIVLVGFLLVGVLAYAPGLAGPWQYDDKRVMLDPAVRERRGSVGQYLIESVGLARDPGGPLGTRSLVQATLLAQWRLHGEKTFWYHAVNVLIHVVVAWLVYLLVGQILTVLHSGNGIHTGNENKNSIPGMRIFWLSLFGGAVFLLHPLQTQAVAYISQRFEAMMALFYLLAVVLYLGGRLQILHSGNENKNSIPGMGWWWFAGSWLAALAAMSSKEVAITLPIVLVLLEAIVVRQRLRLRNWLVLGVFFVIAVKIPIQVMMSAQLGAPPTVGDVVNQAAAVDEPHKLGVTRETYLLSQINVVRTYIRMLVLPYGQSIDHDYPVTTSFWNVPTVLSALVLVGILGVGIYGWRRGLRELHSGNGIQIGNKNKNSIPGMGLDLQLLSLGIAWFFVTLSVSSSLIPIRDLIYEHRVYLPMVGFVLVLIFLILKVWERDISEIRDPFNQDQGKQKSEIRRRESWLVSGASLLLAVYFVLTLFRSSVWASEVRLWEDAWKKGPGKARTNKNYGFVLTQEGKLREGIERLEKGVELNSEDQDYRITLGAAYLQTQEWEKAKQQFEKAVELKPNKADGWNNLGVAEFQLQKYQESRTAFVKAIEVDENFYMAWLGLGGAELMTGDFGAAEMAMKRAIELEPRDPRAYSNLVSLYLRAKNWQKALEAIGRLEAVDPDYLGLAEKKQAVLEKLR